jgi:type IV secretory pathway VirB2 component (pilin)
MSPESFFLVVIGVAMICLTLLIGQCSQRLGDCQIAAIKAGINAEDVYKVCRV